MSRDDTQRAQQRAFKAALYADPQQREVLKARARDYGRRNSEKRKAYMKIYSAEQRAEFESDPAKLEAHRAAAREKSALHRARLNADPVRRQKHLESRQDKRAGAVTEREVEKYLVARVTELGGFCPKFVDPGRRGAPDRIVMLPGHSSVYVELKRPIGGEVSVSQERFHAKIRAAGQLVWVINTKAAVDALLADLDLSLL